MSGPAINDPDVVSEVRAAFDQYEAALVANDVVSLNRWFWDSALTIRYGIAEHNLGIAAIRSWRLSAAAVHPGRALQETVITTFGRDFASVCTQFSTPDTCRTGRQSQTWARLDGGWRIVAAHVSLPAD